MFDLLNEFITMMSENDIDVINRNYLFTCDENDSDFKLKFLSRVFKMQNLLYHNQCNIDTSVSFLDRNTGNKVTYRFLFSNDCYRSEDGEIVFNVKTGEFDKENITKKKYVAPSFEIENTTCSSCVNCTETDNTVNEGGDGKSKTVAEEIYEKINRPHVTIDSNKYITDILDVLIDKEMYSVVKNGKGGTYEKIAFDLEQIKSEDTSGVLSKCKDDYFIKNDDLMQAIKTKYGFSYCSIKKKGDNILVYCGLIEKEENNNE